MTSKIAALLTTVLLLAGCDFAIPTTASLNPATDAGAEGRPADSADHEHRSDGPPSGDAQTDAAESSDATGDGVSDADAPTDAMDDGTDDPATTDNDGMRGDMGLMMAPDVSDGLPEGHPGSGQVLTSRRAPASSDRIGVFRTRCDFSHMAFDDPIVAPGQPGASHLHTFFGNTMTDANSTAASIATTGNSTCRGGIANRTAYWVPAVIDVATRKPLVPSLAQVYYRSGYGGVVPSDVQAMPDGLRMIAGNTASTGDASDNPRTHWQCRTKNTSPSREDRTSHIPSDCGPGEALRLTVEFPQCWDGENLDSSDHRGHMAYAQRGCPSSHPVPLPQVVLNVVYPLDARAPEGWRLVSDNYDHSLPGGRSLHADWFNGWDSSVVETWLDGCYTQPKNCKDGNLNNGMGLDRP